MLGEWHSRIVVQVIVIQEKLHGNIAANCPNVSSPSVDIWPRHKLGPGEISNFTYDCINILSASWAKKYLYVSCHYRLPSRRSIQKISTSLSR